MNRIGKHLSRLVDAGLVWYFSYLSKQNVLIINLIISRVRKIFIFIRQLYVKEKVNLLLTIVAGILTLCLLEFYFRYFPHTLPVALGNYLASAYNDGLSGIYRYRPDMKMYMMRPHYERQMYFNRYTWHHKTDAAGFRNPEDQERADIVLLGDSMIYGHGLEEPSTVRHYLEARVKKPVANLGIQGGSIHQAYQILKTYGRALHPHHVYLFFLVNDIHDLTVYLSDHEIKRFLDIPIEDHSQPYFHVKPQRRKYFDYKFYTNELYVFKAYEFFKSYIQKHWLQASRAEASSWESLAWFDKRPRYRLAMKFHLHALRKIRQLAISDHFRFTHVFIYTGMRAAQEDMYEHILEAFCQAHDIDFYSLRDDFERALKNGETLFLPADGHFTDRGAQLVAQLLEQHMQVRR